MFICDTEGLKCNHITIITLLLSRSEMQRTEHAIYLNVNYFDLY